MNQSDPQAFVREFSSVRICDTENYAGDSGFAAYREMLARTAAPWSMEFDAEAGFHGRIAGVPLPQGGIIRSKTRCPSLVATRAKREISNTTVDCFSLVYIISGDLIVEQAGRTAREAKRGIIVFDQTLPTKLVNVTDATYEFLSLNIPKSEFSGVPDADSIFRNVAIGSDQTFTPLLSCLISLAECLASGPHDERLALYEASTILLPMTVRREKYGELVDRLELLPNRYIRELLHFINENIRNADLSPASAARHLGLSLRNVHRHFAANGTTFGAYVMSRRLEKIRQDLIAEGTRHIPIADIAMRWGFNDLSTFTRAFRKRFGCTARQYRNR